jgi:hypothetical protein
MNRTFIHGVARENFGKKIRSMTTLVMPHILESWQLCYNMLLGWQMSYSQKIEFFGANLRWGPSPSKLEGPHKVILGDFPFFMEQATCALRATSHMRLRARDHYTPSTFIGGKDGGGPVRFTHSLRDQRSMWMPNGCNQSLCAFPHGIEWIMFHGHLDYFPKTTSWR